MKRHLELIINRCNYASRTFETQTTPFCEHFGVCKYSEVIKDSPNFEEYKVCTDENKRFIRKEDGRS